MICPKCGIYIVSHVPCRQCGYLEGETREESNVSIDKGLDAEAKEDESSTNESFYSTTWFAWLMLIVAYPIGLILLWKYNKHNLVARSIITFIFLSFFIYVHLNFNQSLIATNTLNSAILLERDQQKAEESAKANIRFQNISLKNYGNFGVVKGQVTNQDIKTRSFTFTVSLYDADQKLISTVTDAIINLGPQQTKSFEVLPLDQPVKAKYKSVAVDYFLE